MEIAGAGRLKVRITPLDVGKRVSIRRFVDPAEGGGAFTDTVGVLTSWNEGVLVITRRDGRSVQVPEGELAAGKVVPAAPARRRGLPATDFLELTRVCARAWQPVESEPLGEWLLRAAYQAAPGGPRSGTATGFTRRANSALPLGDPGVPLDEALTRVRGWYAERGLPAYVQAATGAAGTQEVLCAELERRGWRREVSADVRIAGLAPLGDLDADVARVTLARSIDELGPGWLRRYQRSAEPGAHVLKVLGGGPSVWFASVAGEGADGRDAPAAIGRCVVDGRWAGFMAVEVDPAQRRRGLATAVMTALARRALEEGASAAWLQVEADNAGAGALYEGMGFTTHHSYHHYRAPEGPLDA
ncbi:GNAT family N-acetyltransferase [Streptomyces sp. NPDC047315]|uniref:GNAT family N-acetyltransferase n=1 Tax=Streptomyces sp. NPDC047315 TaxID=3155142 RepID=UPI0033D08A51